MKPEDFALPSNKKAARWRVRLSALTGLVLLLLATYMTMESDKLSGSDWFAVACLTFSLPFLAAKWVIMAIGKISSLERA
jgi:uncharacterized membrane protein YhdT